MIEHEGSYGFDFSLTEQFTPWQDSGIDIEPIYEALELHKEHNRYDLIFIQIIDSKIYYEYDRKNSWLVCERRSNILLQSLNELVEQHKITNVFFAYSLRDQFKPSEEDYTQIFSKFPVFVPNNKKSDEMTILFPDEHMLSAGALDQDTKLNWASVISIIEDTNIKYPFDKKYDIAFWRGADSGALFTFDKYPQQHPRGKIVYLSEQHPELINAKFSQIKYSKDEKFNNYFRNKTDPMPREEFFKHRYVLDVDGWGISWDREECILWSNSLLLKVDSELQQWFYDGIKPDKHFILIDKDLSNIYDKLYWAQTHPIEVKNIIEESTKFAKHNLSPQNISYYMSIILNKYAELQNFNLSNATLTKRLHNLDAIKEYSNIVTLDNTNNYIIGLGVFYFVTLLAIGYQIKKFNINK